MKSDWNSGFGLLFYLHVDKSDFGAFRNRFFPGCAFPVEPAMFDSRLNDPISSSVLCHSPKRRWKVGPRAATLAAWFTLFLVAGLLVRPFPAAEKPKTLRDEDYRLYEMLVEAIDQVERNYVKGIDRRDLIEAAIRGVLEKLDPHSDYIGPDDVDEFRLSVDNEFAGIGVQVEMERGRLRVVSPIAGTPAQAAGICAGDYIVQIGDSPTKELTLDDAIALLKGEAGTEVVLTVLRPANGEKKRINITRANIALQTVRGFRKGHDGSWEYLFEPKTGLAYIQISAFCRGTSADIRKVLEGLREKNIHGLVLDLRFNPGGLLESAVEVADLFVEEGRIVSISGRNYQDQAWDATKSGTITGFPIAVLVNRYSASGSEIVAACLQDHGRGVVIGERTWGKGSVQNVIELEKGKSVLKLTTGAYCRPSGKNIHRFPDATEEEEWGVLPDDGYQVEQTDADVARIYQRQRHRDLFPAPRASDDGGRPTPSVFQNDVAFSKAIGYLKDQLGKKAKEK